MKWLYTVVYSGNVDADTEDEAEEAALEQVDLGFAATETCDVEPIGEPNGT